MTNAISKCYKALSVFFIVVSCIVVSQSKLISLTIIGGDNLQAGEAVNLVVMGTYSDGSTRDLTNEVAWSSSDTEVAVFDSSIRAMKVGNVLAGETDITAKVGNQTTTTKTLLLKRPTGQIFVGGLHDLRSFLEPSASDRLRRLGASLHIHFNGWAPLSSEEKKQLIANFSGTGPITAELPGNPAIPEGEPGWQDSPLTDLQKSGAMDHSLTVIFNNDSSTDVRSTDSFRELTDSWLGQGAANASSVETPNDVADESQIGDFSSSRYDGFRERARIGGVVLFDSPPEFYYWRQEGGPYRQWIKDAVAWANSEGLVTGIFISSGGGSANDPDGYFEATKRFIGEFNKLPNEGRPQQYIVSNYYSDGVFIGTDDDGITDKTVPRSVASVAVWVMKNAQTYVLP